MFADDIGVKSLHQLNVTSEQSQKSAIRLVKVFKNQNCLIFEVNFLVRQILKRAYTFENIMLYII